MVQILRKAQSKIKNQVFFLTEQRRFNHAQKRQRKILFSGLHTWTKTISFSFPFNFIQIGIGDLTLDNLGKYDLVVPLGVEAVKRVYSIQKSHPKRCFKSIIPMASEDVFNLCDDKTLFNQTLVKKGFADFIPRMYGPHAYPYFLKKKNDAWGKHSYVVHNSADEAHYAKELTSSDYFTQQAVLGKTEFATHILFLDGEIVESLNIRYHFSSNSAVKGKEVYVCHTVTSCPHLNVFRAMLRAINYSGICCINYKEENGKPMIIEINPRIGGSLCRYIFIFLKHLL